MIREPRPAESDQLVSLASATGIFKPGEAEALLGGVLEDYHQGRLGEGHQVQVWVDEPARAPAGWVYFAPSFKAEGVWDLWWIGVSPERQREGIGGELLSFVESKVRAAGCRVLIIETSSMPSMEPVRRFYAKRGYLDCGRIPDFYADGDDKVTFARRLG